MNKWKLLKKALGGTDNLRFGDMVKLIEAFGFRRVRVNGSHHIFEHPNMRELINIQNKKGKAKPYQIRQFLDLIEQYNVDLGDK
jgi:predicted RNA binding protein YcfA (HicA-like mRNA interferase family)